MYKIPAGPTAFFDVDDTLVMWDIPEGYDGPLIEITCRDHTSSLIPNKYNIDLLIKMATRGHAVVVWSAGGSDWAESVVKALKIERFVHLVSTKPTYWIDDLTDPADVLGKHSYIDIDGNRIGNYSSKQK